MLGDKATIPLKLTRNWPDFKQPLQVTPLPQAICRTGMTAANVTLARTRPKAAWSSMCRPTWRRAPTRWFPSFAADSVQQAAIPRARPATSMSCMPSTPVLLTVLPKQVATVSLGDANPKVKVGEQTEVMVKVARQNDYDGEFKV